MVKSELFKHDLYALIRYECLSISSMRFSVIMINQKGKTYEETIIADNKKEAMWQAQDCNPYSKVIQANWVYK